MNPQTSYRLFFGLEIPDRVKQPLLAIRQSVAGARWQRPDQLHLTLAFLGRVEAHQLPDVFDAARNLPVEPFNLTVRGVGCFGDPDHPVNLWAGAQPVGELADLKERLARRLASLGGRREKRTFRPHITLSRFSRTPGPVTDLLQIYKNQSFGSFPVDSVALFESIREDQGSVYRIAARFPLIGAG